MTTFSLLYRSAILILLTLTTAALAPESPAATPAKSASASKSAAPAKPIRDKWAVVIGIDRFKDKTIPPLKFASKDARDFAKFLVDEGNFASDHVKVIVNEEATERNILNVLGDKWLPRRALPDDLIVIFVSSHGSPKELDRKGANYLVAHDTLKNELYTSGIKLEDLGPDIQNRTECNRVVLILDACNSGAAKAGGKGLYRTQNFDVSKISERAGEGLVIISSSSQNQRSWESRRYKNSVFTKCLINTLAQSKKDDQKIEDVFSNLKEKVEQEVKFDRQVLQTPVMSSKWEGPPLKITTEPAQPRTVKPLSDEKLKTTPKVKTEVASTTKGAPPLVANAATVQTTTAVQQSHKNIAPDNFLNENIAVLKITYPKRLGFKKRMKRRRHRHMRRESLNSGPKLNSNTVPELLRALVTSKLMNKTRKGAIPPKTVSQQCKLVFGSQEPNFFFPKRNQMMTLAKNMDAKYLIMVNLTQLKISEKPTLGAQVNIQATAKIIDGRTGVQRAVIKESLIKPSARVLITKDKVTNVIIPTLADKIASALAKKI